MSIEKSGISSIFTFINESRIGNVETQAREFRVGWVVRHKAGEEYLSTLSGEQVCVPDGVVRVEVMLESEHPAHVFRSFIAAAHRPAPALLPGQNRIQ